MSRTRVHVISLGGTITMRAGTSGGIVPTLTAADVIATVPGLDAIAEVSVETASTASSTALRIEDVVDVVGRAHAAIADGASGVVVLQGTDTMEESAFVADVLHVLDAPLVFTGAMRGPDEPGADGPANVLAAVVAAASPATRGLGVLVVMGGQLHAARAVRKADSASPAAFVSVGGGPLGWVVEGHARVRVRPVPVVGPRPTLAAVAGVDVPPVVLHRVTLGDEGRLLAGIEATGARALVVDGFGAGHVPAWMVGTLADLALRLPVVLATRTGGGEVLRHTYGFPGSERDLLGRGLLWAGALDGLRARLLVALALAAGTPRDGLQVVLDPWTP